MESKSLLKNFLGYLRHPVYYSSGSKKSRGRKALEILRLFALLYLIVIILGVITSVILTKVGYDIQQHSVIDLVENAPILETLFLSAVLAPLTEELTFRLFLRFSYKKLALALTFITIFLFDLLKDYIFTSIPQWILNFRTLFGGLSYLIFILLFGLLLYFLLKKFLNYERAANFFEKRIGLLFYLSVIIFGLVHITNFSNLGNLILIAPIFILPQIVAGLFLAYIRMNYGFRWGILTHSIYNSITLVPFIVFSFGSEQLHDVLSNSAQNISGILKLSSSDLFLISIVGLGALLVFLLFISLNIQLLVEYFLNKKNKY